MKHLFQKARMVAALGATALFLMLGSVGAQAAASPGSLAAGENLFVFSYDSNDTKPNLFGIDPTTAITTAVGNSGPLPAESVYWTNAAFDPTTQTSYVMASRGKFPNFYSTLFSVDPTTGQFTKVADITADDSAINTFGFAIASDGSAFVTTNAAGTISLHSLNLATGAATGAKVLTGSIGSSYASLASDPVTNKLFLSLSESNSQNNNLGSRIFEINQSTGAVTASSLFSGANGSTPKPIVGMQFDANGKLWFLYGDGYGTTTELWSADAANFPTSAVKSADLNGASTEAIALLLVPGSTPSPGPTPEPTPTPQLAATGSSTNLFAAATLALIAIGFAVMSRSQKPTHLSARLRPGKH